jgi:hypothetical protein
MTALLLPAVAMLVAVGVADTVSGSWQLLIRPTTRAGDVDGPAR